ncbi:uncharacterized protein LACBIDRAFT_307606 [Laccaria bicolor S238N-H82]|uniref:Predicted protein n=1 Tax=Laccaria bicolor (strain S238N-H82 / ATCC MYA-4686) TaxID=486041 RepID=B0DQJ8_LACBS|nr:uncharacterized protein LACBIDRAFT_307606 [Laccaria bicolor S238N-H82]EDR03127.1 predicted protein [Laccaria bicolor S238N-H82]|eukprot:XP_001886268.1 predicted protein [Laccaria bicolor S238N-H82]
MWTFLSNRTYTTILSDYRNTQTLDSKNSNSCWQLCWALSPIGVQIHLAQNHVCHAQQTKN